MDFVAMWAAKMKVNLEIPIVTRKASNPLRVLTKYFTVFSMLCTVLLGMFIQVLTNIAPPPTSFMTQHTRPVTLPRLEKSGGRSMYNDSYCSTTEKPS